jgi:hypothetical protein
MKTAATEPLHDLRRLLAQEVSRLRQYEQSAALLEDCEQLLLKRDALRQEIYDIVTQRDAHSKELQEITAAEHSAAAAFEAKQKERADLLAKAEDEHRTVVQAIQESTERERIRLRDELLTLDRLYAARVTAHEKRLGELQSACAAMQDSLKTLKDQAAKLAQ